MHLIGAPFSQYDWLPRKSDGACFRLASKWAIQSLCAGLETKIHGFPRKGEQKEKTVANTLRKTKQYEDRAEELGNDLARQEDTTSGLPPDLAYQAIYQAETDMAGSWAQAIAFKNTKNIKVNSVRLERLSGWVPSMDNVALESDFAFVYSFHYEKPRGCRKAPAEGAHSVAFLRIGTVQRYFDPNIGEHVFQGPERASVANMLGAIETELRNRYFRRGTLEHSIVHVFTVTDMQV